MPDHQNQPIDPWVQLAARKISERYLPASTAPNPSRLHQRLMDKVDDALFWLDVADGPDGFIGVQNFRQTLQRKLTQYAQRQGGAEQEALQQQIQSLVQRIDTIPATEGRIDRERLEGAISTALRQLLASNPQLIREIQHVSGEELGSLRATHLMDQVVERYRAQAPAK